MSTPLVEIRGLDEIIKRMRAYPQKLNAAIKITLRAGLLALWENVPAYPPPPEDSTYVRTGTLGRTLGSSEGGGKGSQPDVYEVRKLGAEYEGHFGTNLEYAGHVIGPDEGDPHQAWMHKGRWWQMHNIAERADAKIQRIFKKMADKLAEWLDGKGQ